MIFHCWKGADVFHNFLFFCNVISLILRVNQYIAIQVTKIQVFWDMTPC